MKNIRFWLTLTILLLGIACLRFSYTRGSIENWAPVHLPLPGAGLVVASYFHIESGGTFDLTIVIPISDDNNSVGLPVLPPIKSMLKVTTTGEDEFINTQYVKEFQLFSETMASHLYHFRGSAIILPRKGDYKIEIVNEDYDGIFENCSKTGGMIRLERFDRLETGLLYGLLHVLSYALIAISIIGMIYCNFSKNKIPRSKRQGLFII